MVVELAKKRRRRRARWASRLVCGDRRRRGRRERRGAASIDVDGHPALARPEKADQGMNGQRATERIDVDGLTIRVDLFEAADRRSLGARLDGQVSHAGRLGHPRFDLDA